MNLVYHSHSSYASAAPLITTASFPVTSCVAPCTPHRCLNVKSSTFILHMGFLIFDCDVLVFTGQIRSPLRNRLEPAIYGTRKIGVSESELLCQLRGRSCLAVNIDAVKKTFGCTIQSVKSFSNVQTNFIVVPAFLRRHSPLSQNILCHYMIDKAAFKGVFFLLLHASSYFINRRTNWVTFNLSLSCQRLLGSRAISMEKHEVIGDLPADLRAEECDLEALIMPHDEREWPKDWRAYAACFAGFCGMVLCW